MDVDLTLFCVDRTPTTEQQTIMDEMLSMLRLRVASTYLATDQAIKLVKLFPVHYAGARMNAVVAVFGRVLRLHEAIEKLRNLVPRIERGTLIRRLGWLNALNPSTCRIAAA